MVWKRLALAMGVIAGASFSASAQTQQDWDWCKASEADRVSLDQQIKGCTALIDSGKQPTEILAAAFNYRGFSYHGKGEFARAIQDYSRAIKLMPDYADAYSNRGADYNNLGRYDLAIRDLSEAIKLEPREAVNFKNRSFSHAKRGDYRHALADLEHAAKLNPSDLETAYYLRLARQAKGSASSAEIAKQFNSLSR
jgi:tetratricopeptide (TPR) repeat protein